MTEIETRLGMNKYFSYRCKSCQGRGYILYFRRLFRKSPNYSPTYEYCKNCRGTGGNLSYRRKKWDLLLQPIEPPKEMNLVYRVSRTPKREK